jgi:hypothetical protein
MCCQICHRTVAYQPGKASEVLTEHYRRAHPEALSLPSASSGRGHCPQASSDSGDLAHGHGREPPAVTERGQVRCGVRARSRRYLKPHFGCLRCNTAGPGPRRGHVICSAVFAVAAVTAAGVPPCPGSRPARASSGESVATSLIAFSSTRGCCQARDGSGQVGSCAFRVAVTAPIAWILTGQGSAAPRGGLWRRQRVARTPEGLASGSLPPVPGSRAGNRALAASSAARSALSGAPRRRRAAGPR